MTTTVRFSIRFDYVTDTNRVLNRPQLYKEVDLIKMALRQTIARSLMPVGSVKHVVDKYIIVEDIIGEDHDMTIDKYKEQFFRNSDGKSGVDH